MSEFTSGNLALLKDKAAIMAFNPIYVKDLNDKWFVFFTEDTSVSEELPESLLKISEMAPLVYFYNFEDHCWGYRVVDHAKIIGSLHVPYEMEEFLMMKLVEERYPDEDPIELLYMNPPSDNFYDDLLSEIQSSDSFHEAINEQFRGSHVDSLRLFDVQDAIIGELEAKLTVDYFNSLESKHQLVDEFKTLLQLEEMEWISADRINEDN